MHEKGLVETLLYVGKEAGVKGLYHPSVHVRGYHGAGLCAKVVVYKDDIHIVPESRGEDVDPGQVGFEESVHDGSGEWFV